MSYERRIEQLERSLQASAEHKPMHILEQNEDRTTYTVRTSRTLPEGTILTVEEKDQLFGLKIVVVRPQGV